MAEQDFAPRHPVDRDQVVTWVGHTVDDLAGTGVGKVEEILVDAEHGEPSWLVVKTGRFGRRTVVPAELAAGGVGHVWVPYPKELIRDAPEVRKSEGLDAERELALCRHYGIPPQRRSLTIPGE